MDIMPKKYSFCLKDNNSCDYWTIWFKTVFDTILDFIYYQIIMSK